jgi:hypothetical protein
VLLALRIVAALVPPANTSAGGSRLRSRLAQKLEDVGWKPTSVTWVRSVMGARQHGMLKVGVQLASESTRSETQVGILPRKPWE